MIGRLWRLLAEWCCPAAVWREALRVRRGRLGDWHSRTFLERPWQ
jgi:hypothetical protein